MELAPQMTPSKRNNEVLPRAQAFKLRGLSTICGVFLLSGLVAGCSGGLPKLDKLNPFKEKQQPLPGKRISIMPQSDRVGGGELAAATTPITLPIAVLNTNWTQPGGTPSNAPGHLSTSASLRRAWSRDAGTGTGYRGRLTSTPIVYGGRIYTLDASSLVSSFNASSGAQQWRRSFIPEKETGAEGYGGGLAIDNGRLYVSNGFGTVYALDPSNGKPIWEKKLGLPVRASPTAVGDRVFVITKGGVFFCLSGADGSELWQFRGLPQVTSLSYSPSPAVDGDVVTVPYPNGDVVALSVADGTLLWQENLAKTRTTTSFAAMSDAASPAMANGVAYSIGHGGRFVATQQTTGERLWALEIASVQRPWVAGNNVFVVNTIGQLMAVDSKAGTVRWTTKLPGAKIWSGPVLAGGMLWLTSSKGQLVGVEATAGRVATKINVGAKIYVPPVVADGRLYVLTDNAKLVAFR
jgi:outer membrane protein assembly factor BamB